jgi:integrase
MASIVKRGKTYNVVYRVEKKQNWETFKTEGEAVARKIEIEDQLKKGTFVPLAPMLIKDFLAEYVERYGRAKWSHSAYSNNTSLISNYINPYIGNRKMDKITTRTMNSYFENLKTKKTVKRCGQKEEPGFISDRIVLEINNLLLNAFDRSAEWGYVSENPVTGNFSPDYKSEKTEVWEPETAQIAISLCSDLNLLACMYLSISCSMCLGEILGLRWQNLSFGDSANNFDDAKLDIKVQMQRISLESYVKLQQKNNEIKFIFPQSKNNLKSMMVLKTLRAESCERVVCIPPSVAKVLFELKQEQDKFKEQLGSKYQDCDLIIASDYGRPFEKTTIRVHFKTFIAENNLPEVTLQSLRYIITEKMLNPGEEDAEYVVPEIVAEKRAHILRRRQETNAKLLYKVNNQKLTVNPSDSPLKQLLCHCLHDPKIRNKLQGIIQQ